jgi:endonuclease G
MVAVPTHFFKVVLGDTIERDSDGNKKMVVGAFVMPNLAIEKETPLSSFVVPLSALEEVSGELLGSERGQPSC